MKKKRKKKETKSLYYKYLYQLSGCRSHFHVLSPNPIDVLGCRSVCVRLIKTRMLAFNLSGARPVTITMIMTGEEEREEI